MSCWSIYAVGWGSVHWKQTDMPWCIATHGSVCWNPTIVCPDSLIGIAQRHAPTKLFVFRPTVLQLSFSALMPLFSFTIANSSKSSKNQLNSTCTPPNGRQRQFVGSISTLKIQIFLAGVNGDQSRAKTKVNIGHVSKLKLMTLRIC